MRQKVWKYYYKDGQLKKETKWENDNEIHSKYWNKDGEQISKDIYSKSWDSNGNAIK